MVYQPMLELLAHLRANGFKTFIVSGGGIEFMRAFAEKVYGIPPEQVVVGSGKLKLEVRNGKPVLVKLPEIDFVDDKDGKPIGIQKFIGRRPIAAFGNSVGDDPAVARICTACKFARRDAMSPTTRRPVTACTRSAKCRPAPVWSSARRPAPRHRSDSRRMPSSAASGSRSRVRSRPRAATHRRLDPSRP